MQFHLVELSADDVIGNLECNYFLRLNLEVSEQLNLLEVKGAAIEDPAVQAAVRLAQPLVHQVNNDLIRHDSILSDVAFKLARVVVVIVATGHFSDQLLHLHVHNLVLFCDAKSELLFFGARRTHEDDALGSAGSICVLQLENAVDLLNNSHFALVALQLGNETSANVLHSLNLQVVLEDSILRNSLSLAQVVDANEARLNFALARKVALNRFECHLVVLVEQNELVWDDSHLLERDGLSLRPGESLDDPAFLALLHLLNLLAH
mmetsp:Transcript_35634/g.46895  ORF Transcript_35634/g.46895 Transcript_35634/m.46895 type:complete len:264 (+) Transcript_35634:413-1204(+)